MKNKNLECHSWYDKSYSKDGFFAQRMYPNEELLRFFGRELFNLPVNQRKKNKILEIGCGSGANLWMIAKEGFQAYGLDLSKESLALAKKMLEKWGVNADLKIGDMLNLPFANKLFNVVVDVFSSNCLTTIEYDKCISEVSRILKKEGLFFSYVPSTGSDAFINYKPAKKIDDWTLNGIYRKSSPFYGNFYPFRFTNERMIRNLAKKYKFKIEYIEKNMRTYHKGNEKFEFLVFVIKKQ
jgi:ubiquinone/menaquinone biosynthesis C-methylase UbiE